MSNNEVLPKLELGWMMVGKLGPSQLESAKQARRGALELLQNQFPEFHWTMPLIHRTELGTSPRVQGVELLEAGVLERNIHHWDFTILITSADLISYYNKDAIALSSRSLEGVVVSTRRLTRNTLYEGETEFEEQEVRVETPPANRIQTLVLHALGHFCGLGHSPQVDNFMFDFEAIEDLDGPHHFDSQQKDRMRADLLEVADLRLEEVRATKRPNSFWFYLKAAWINRSDLAESLLKARPWEFPYRLSRLTATAISTLMIFLVTAEAWELGMSQSTWFVSFFSFLAVAFTSSYTLVRQRLLVRRERTVISEQNVITNLSTAMIVSTGILTTYIFLFLLALTLSRLLFGPELVVNWSASTDEPPRMSDFVTLSAFVAALGIFIGALGASFEQQNYFRHVTFVDEEI